MPPEVRRFVLWHRRGHVGLKRALRVPGPFARMLGDQDGLFASACNQYRASMNHVADWARAEGLMDHSGMECVPRQVSLLEAHMNQPTRVGLLQARDGYDPDEPLRVGVDLPPGYAPPLADLRELIAATPLFAMLHADEIDLLARTARPLTFGPMERILIQGQPGESLFVVVQGEVDVMLRRADGVEVNLGTRSHGAVLGEMSLLTGQPRSATVRALDGAVIYEIGPRQYEPILAARPSSSTRSSARWRSGYRRRVRCSSATTPTRRARASPAGSGACWRVPELAEQPQRVHAGVRHQHGDGGTGTGPPRGEPVQPLDVRLLDVLQPGASSAHRAFSQKWLIGMVTRRVSAGNGHVRDLLLRAENEIHDGVGKLADQAENAGRGGHTAILPDRRVAGHHSRG